MSKITFSGSKGKFVITNKLTYPETINERVYTAIASGMFDAFLPMTIIQKRKETLVECTVQGLIPLSQYFDGIVTKKMFLDFAHQIAVQIKVCEKNMISPNNLDLQSDKIFIDPSTKKVYCIFWPVVNNQRGNPPHLFLRQLPNGLRFNPHEDISYIKTYQAFFGSMEPFSVNSFDRMIVSLCGRRQPSGHMTPSDGLNGRPNNKPTPGGNVMDAGKKMGIEYDPFAAQAAPAKQEFRPQPDLVFCSECGAKNRMVSNFCMQCGKKLKKIPMPAQPAATPVAGKSVAPVTPKPVASAPVKPIVPEPVAPVAPVKPIAPEPVAPVAPIRPIAPEPVAPVAPIKPIAPEPVAPVAPIRPIASEPIAPVVPIQPVAQPAAVTVINAAVGNVSSVYANTDEDPGTMVLGDTAETTLWGGEETARPARILLTREKTGQQVVIDKPEFRIGSDQRFCDLLISDNTFVSRRHADIIQRGERYFVVDNRSTNRTFVDGKVIPAEKEVEIFSGSSLRLANEDFTFTIEA